jgi:hypothetical protein
MRTAYKMLAGNLLAILLMGVLTIGTVTAEDGVHKGGQPEATANSQQAASQSGNNYVFVTPEGGSLSCSLDARFKYLIRKITPSASPLRNQCTLKQM